MLNALLVAIVVASAIWVYLDATKHRIGKVLGVKSMFNMSAGAWAVVTLFLWILGFPAYLLKRKSLTEQASTSPVDVRGRGIKIAILSILGGVWFLATATNALTAQNNSVDGSDSSNKQNLLDSASSAVSSAHWRLSESTSAIDGKELKASRAYPFPDRNTQFQVEITCQPGRNITLGDMAAGAAGSLSSFSPVSMKIKSFVGDTANPSIDSELVSEIYIDPKNGTTFHYPVARVKTGQTIISGPFIFLSLLMGDYSNEAIYQQVETLGKDMPILLELKNSMGTFELNIDQSSEVENVLAACGKNQASLKQEEMDQNRAQAMTVARGELEFSCHFFGDASAYDQASVDTKLQKLSIPFALAPAVEMNCETSAPQELSSFKEGLKTSYDAHRAEAMRQVKNGVNEYPEYAKIPMEDLCSLEEYIAYIRTLKNGYADAKPDFPGCERWNRSRDPTPSHDDLTGDSSDSAGQPPSQDGITGLASAAREGQSNDERIPRARKATNALESKPSFDCERASGYAEKEICADEVLSDLDRTMVKKFVTLSRAPASGVVLKATQRMWISTRNSCTDRACLALNYMNRIHELDEFEASKR